MNKTINSVCCCKTVLNYWKDHEVIMLSPCEHLIHKQCFNEKNTDKCPYCDQKVTSIIRADSYKNNPNLYQQCVDILAMTNIDDTVDVNYDKAIFNLPRIASLAARIPFTKGFENGRALCGDVLRLSNLKIKVKGLKKIKDEPKIFVVNHTSYLDFCIIYYVLKLGFLATSSIVKNPITRSMVSIIPTLLIEIGKKGGSDTVNRMKEYVENTGPLCIFPEGMITHPATIGKFRTGAFMVGVPIYPVVLNYKNRILDLGLMEFCLKYGSGYSEVVEMQILDPFYPPFDDEKIELVRKAMADAGNFHLSRVSNKDIDNTGNKSIGRKKGK